MADRFTDPTSQAKLDKLLAALQGKQAELNAVIAEARAAAGELGTVSAEAAATQQAQARELSKAGAPRTAAADTTAALRERVAIQKQLNALVEQEVKLRAEAAAATNRGAPTTAEQRVLTQMQGRGGVLLGGGGGGGGAPKQAVQQLSEEQQKLIARSELAARSEALLGAAAQRNVLIMGQASNEFQRHGALTTEFIQAAARGQVTLREFGSQIGQTVGKFAGWTLAATAVYGVVGAVQQLAKGAIDAQAGVQGLTRFIPDLNRGMASLQVGQISQDLNVPIEQTTEAAGAFARIFKNQADVMTASRVAITATKLDNIDLADSYRYLTAFTQEYGLSASQLPGLFDQIEAAQAKGGARVSELFPALARSVAAVKNMGGDINQLLALEATAIVRTGQTGNVVGTAFSRGAANFWTSRGSQQTLSKYGINAAPDVGYTQALTNAIRQVSAQGSKLTGPQVQEISKAFFGPLRGGLLAGLFRGAGQLQSFGEVTAPQASRGQAQKEMNALLGQADQQIKAIGVNMQALGASLSTSGLLTPVGLFVKGLNQGLSTTTGLVRAWGQLPGIVKSVAGTAAVLFGTRAVTQKVGLPAAIPFFGRTQAQSDRLALTKGLGDTASFYQDQFSNTSRNAALASLRTQSAQRAVVAAREAAVSGGGATQLLAAQAAAQKTYEAELARQRQLELERAALGKEAILAETQLNAVTADINRGLTAQQAAQRQGLFFRRSTLTQGKMQPGAVTGVVGQGIGSPVVPMEQYTAPIGPATQRAAQALERESGQIGLWAATKAKLTRDVADYRATFLQLAGGTEAEAAAIRGSVTAEARVAASTGLVGAAVTSAKMGAATATTAVKGFGAGLLGLAGSINPLIAALVVLPVAWEVFSKRAKAVDDAIAVGQDGFRKGWPGNTQQPQFQLSTPSQAVNQTFGAIGTAWQQDLAKLSSTQKGRQQLSRISTEMRQHAMRALDVSGLSEKDINQYYRNLAGSLQKAYQLSVYGPGSTAAQMAYQRAGELSRAAKSMTYMPLDVGVGPVKVPNLVGSLLSLPGVSTLAKGAGYTSPLEHQKKQQQAAGSTMLGDFFAKTGEAWQDDVKALVGTEAGRKKLWTISNMMRTHSVRALQAQGLSKNEINKYYQGLNTWLQQVYEAGLAAVQSKFKGENLFGYYMGLSPEDAQASLQQTAGQGSLFGKPDTNRLLSGYTALSLRSSRHPDDPKLLAAAQAALSDYTGALGESVQAAIQSAQAATSYGGEVGGLESELGTLRTTGDAIKKRMAQFKNEPKLLAALQALFNDVQAQATQVLNALLSAMQSQNALAVSQVGGNTPEADIARAQKALTGPGGLNAQLQAARSHHAGVGTINDIQTKINDQKRSIAGQQADVAKQQADVAKQTMESYDALAKARISGTSPAADLARANADVTAAVHDLQWDKAHGADRKQLNDDYAKLVSAQNSITDLMRQNAITADQDAQALIQARGALAQAQTTDPVQQATLQLQTDIQLLGAIKPRDYQTYSQYLAAVTQKQAEILKDRQSRTDLTVQGKEDDIQFYLDMGQISNSAAIAQYQALLRMHNLTKATRRGILEKIHQLQSGGDGMSGYDFKPGDIKLPTPYDVSRAMRGAIGARAKQTQAMTAISAPTINVYVRSAGDVLAVADVIEKATGGHLRSRMRAAGVRGA